MEIWNQRMKMLRNNTQVTLKDMADIIGVSEATVQRYESGKVKDVPYQAIIAYADKFNVNPCSIMGWDETNCNSVSNNEFKIIEKYRILDERGKHNVIDTLEREYSYSIDAKKGRKGENLA